MMTSAFEWTLAQCDSNWNSK